MRRKVHDVRAKNLIQIYFKYFTVCILQYICTIKKYLRRGRREYLIRSDDDTIACESYIP